MWLPYFPGTFYVRCLSCFFCISTISMKLFCFGLLGGMSSPWDLDPSSLLCRPCESVAGVISMSAISAPGSSGLEGSSRAATVLARGAMPSFLGGSYEPLYGLSCLYLLLSTSISGSLSIRSTMSTAPDWLGSMSETPDISKSYIWSLARFRPIYFLEPPFLNLPLGSCFSRYGLELYLPIFFGFGDARFEEP